MSRESKVLCLYAGGTLGMIKHGSSGYAPFPGFLTETLRTQTRFHDPHADSIFSWSDTTERFQQWSNAYSHSRPPTRPASPTNGAPPPVASSSSSSSRIPSPSPSPAGSSTLLASGPPFSKSLQVRSSDPAGTSTRYAISKQTLPDGTLLMQLPSLVTPKSSHNGQRIRYTVLEYDPLLDSSEMGLEDWTRMAKDIELNYTSFDAFVVLHGTDTMSYTSSALSFLLENLGKTVIVTGAQVPLSELRNDAIENVLGALILASSYIIPEVGLFFASTLYRGNRSSKVSNNALAAFDSPNMAPLARVGIGIDVAWNLVERPRTVKPFHAHGSMSADVALLRLFPGMPTHTIKHFLKSGLSGLCIESFGAGNAPSRPDLLEAFKEATDAGMVIINITQCLQGEVSAIYAVGKKLAAVNVVAGGDMTPECALTKLAYLLSKPELTRQQVRELMGRSLRGELTSSSSSSASRSPSSSLRRRRTVDKTGGSSRAQMLELLGKILERPGEAEGDEDQATQSGGQGSTAETLVEGKALERDIASAERTILPYLIHRAAASGDVSSLEWHLSALAQLDQETASTPTSHISLHNGSLPDDSTSFSFSNGRSLSSSLPRQDETISARMTSFSGKGGTSSTLPPLDSTYPLHVASARGHAECVSLLLSAGCSVHLKDYGGRSPLFLAASGGHVPVVMILRGAGAHLDQGEDESSSRRDGERNLQCSDEEERKRFKEAWDRARR